MPTAKMLKKKKKGEKEIQNTHCHHQAPQAE